MPLERRHEAGAMVALGDRVAVLTEQAAAIGTGCPGEVWCEKHFSVSYDESVTFATRVLCVGVSRFMSGIKDGTLSRTQAEPECYLRWTADKCLK